jgi:DNA-binding XRE family transcriptional regulator
MWHNGLAVQRQRWHLTQQQLAALVECDPRHISRWEQGVRLPSLPWAFRLAKALDCRIEDLWWEEDD